MEMAWLVKGNGTRTTRPKSSEATSEGIVGVVLGVVPDGGEGRGAGGGHGAGDGTVLIALTDEVDKVLLGAVLLLAVEPLSKARASMRPVSAVWRGVAALYKQSTQGHLRSAKK